jgi:hypothetical protein
LKFKYIIVTSFVFILSSCGGSNEKYIGFYEYENKFIGSVKICEVKKDGDAFLFIEDSLVGSSPIALSQIDGELSYNGASLKLSDNEDILYFGPINGKRVSLEYLSNLKMQIVKNKELCSQAQAKVDTNKGSMERKEWNSYVANLESKAPKDCRLQNTSMGW